MLDLLGVRANARRRFSLSIIFGCTSTQTTTRPLAPTMWVLSPLAKRIQQKTAQPLRTNTIGYECSKSPYQQYCRRMSMRGNCKLDLSGHSAPCRIPILEIKPRNAVKTSDNFRSDVAKNGRHKVEVARLFHCQSNLKLERFQWDRILVVGQGTLKSLSRALTLCF